MQISKIQNNNLQNTNFRAHSYIAGRPESIHKKVIDEIKKTARNIGRKEDVIRIEVNNPVIEEIPAQYPDILPITQKYRKIHVTSYINGHVDKKSIGYCVFGKDKSDTILTGCAIRDYLGELLIKAKEIYSKE